MNTNYATPVPTLMQDTTVPLAEWEKLLMLWTLRSLRPAKDNFTTLSFAIQQEGSKFVVVERINGMCTSDVLDGYSATKVFTNRDEALDYWGRCIVHATPPCTQGALPGLVEACATYIETYQYNGGYGNGPCNQSHARIGE